MNKHLTTLINHISEKFNLTEEVARMVLSSILITTIVFSWSIYALLNNRTPQISKEEQDIFTEMETYYRDNPQELEEGYRPPPPPEKEPLRFEYGGG